MALNVRSSRDRITEAAIELFHARGFHGTTVREIAEAAGLTGGSLYTHFASKADLLFAIVSRVHDEADAALTDALRASGPDPAEQLAALTAAFTRFHIDRPRATRITNREYEHLPAAQRDSVVGRRRSVRELFARVLADGERAGVFALAPLGGQDTVQAASMAIIDMIMLVPEWFDPGGRDSAASTAELHARLALRMAGAVEQVLGGVEQPRLLAPGRQQLQAGR